MLSFPHQNLSDLKKFILAKISSKMATMAAILKNVNAKKMPDSLLFTKEYNDTKIEAIRKPNTKKMGQSANFQNLRWPPAGLLDANILKMNRMWGPGLLMAHAKFQENRTRTFRVIAKRRFRTRWPPRRPFWKIIGK